MLKVRMVRGRERLNMEGAERGNGSEEVRRGVCEKLGWYDEVDERLAGRGQGGGGGGGRRGEVGGSERVE